MSDSDDDPWPGACSGRLRFVSSSYYTNRYTMEEPFPSFFGIDPRPRYTMYDIEGIVLDYIASHEGYVGKMVKYDEGLWKLMRLPPSAPFLLKRIEDYVKPFQQGYLRPCPICEMPRPFYPGVPNGLCSACAASDCAAPHRLDSRQGVPCRPSHHVVFSFQAVAHCPLCQTEVNEERRLGAFCDRCASSECLVDANGNRVRFTRPMKGVGFTVIRYENGEITETPHIGEFVCFFQGVECVADDIGVNDRIIVRCRDRESEKRTWAPISLPFAL